MSESSFETFTCYDSDNIIVIPAYHGKKIATSKYILGINIKKKRNNKLL